MKIDQLHIGYTSTLLEIDQLSLEPGKVYALVGANGRGKSTLIKTLIGQLTPISGSVRVNQKAVSLLSSVEKSKTFGFVQSRFAGVPFMRSKEYVALGRSPYTNAFGRLAKKDEAIIEQSFETMEVTHLAPKFTEELSDGERQMLSIAKVLAQETQYIFLDEPTAFLDYSNKKRVLELLTKVAKEENKCVLYSSHDLEMTVDYSDEIICIPKTENLLVIKSNFQKEDLVQVCF